MRNILLLEPNYKNKYPPIGLMKLSTYHKMLGDNVVFYKGDLKEFIINHAVDLCINKLIKIDKTINWRSKYFSIYNYFKKRQAIHLNSLGLENSKYQKLLLNALTYYKDYYWKKGYLSEKHWNRVYITTLFTFHWDITIKTIEFAKQLVVNPNHIWIGGVMASVIPNEIKKETGLKNIHVGLLNKAGILDKNDIIIDDLPLDYSILHEIEYKYPENNAYYAYTTRGCVRKCEFCAVPIIEPKFNPYISLTEKIRGVCAMYGEKRNLLLLDNNVLASKCFPEIIEEIKSNGFDHNQKYKEPNLLEIAIQNLNSERNEKAYINQIVGLYNDLLIRVSDNIKQKLYNTLSENNLLHSCTASKDDILSTFPILNPIYEKFRNKTLKKRYVDFNQGVDARLLTDKKAKLLSQIPIRPLRIAFDSMEYKSYYIEAILKANKYGIKHFSNYLLYNFEDTPEDLYLRLKLNVELCETHKLNIYSFPMKYHPIFGDYKLNRDFVGPHWNRKFIRAVQIILNATKGKIGKGKSFFLKAFGKDEEEYFKLLYMPETYILYRFFFEKEGFTQEWWKEFNALNKNELRIAKEVIESNDFSSITSLTSNPKIIKLLNHYSISRDEITKSGSELAKLKAKFDELSRVDKFSILEYVD